MYAHTTGATALNLFLLIFSLLKSGGWKFLRCMMGNNFKRQKIIVLPSLLLKSLFKSLDVRGCQMTVCLTILSKSFSFWETCALFQIFQRPNVCQGHTGGKTHHAVKTGICPGCPKGLSVSFRSELAEGSGPGAPSGEFIFLVSMGVETHSKIYGKKKRMTCQRERTL